MRVARRFSLEKVALLVRRVGLAVVGLVLVACTQQTAPDQTEPASAGSDPVPSATSSDSQRVAQVSPDPGTRPTPRPTDPYSEDVAVAQYTKDLAGCLEEAGFRARIIPPKEGGWGIAPPENASASYNVKVAECTKRVGPFPAPVVTEEYAEQVWARELEIYQCLKRNGFSLSSEPPDKASFVSEMLVTDMGPWTAYGGLSGGATEFGRASAACPQQR